MADLPYEDRFFNMRRDDFLDVPRVELPAGYALRPYRPGDDDVWTGLQRAAEPFIDIKDDLFEDQYGAHRDALPDRMWFVHTADGIDVASISAWWEKGPEVEGDRGRAVCEAESAGLAGRRRDAPVG